MSLREFSEVCGVHQVQLCQIETGVVGLGTKSALSIYDAFRSEFGERGVALEDLIRGSMEIVYDEPEKPACEETEERKQE